jgi:sulfotransferase
MRGINSGVAKNKMQSKIHFISGLPRSGSTLLAGILLQNPRLHAGMSSPVGGMYRALEESMSRKNEAAIFISDQQRQSILRGVFSNYYGEIDSKEVIFDTNRIWCTKLPALSRLFPEARVICCVRSISWIVDSIEKLARQNAFELSGLFGFDAGSTVYTRVNSIAKSSGLVGYALDALREAYYGAEANRIMLLEYDDLCRDPEASIARLYDFIGQPRFKHDFDNVEYEADNFDLQLGAKGLHTIRRKVEWIERPTILPPELFHRFQNDAFWRRT